jgi:phosphoribosylformimino-5-aminoimidazole carboxamide ribotide isomerase
MDLIPAIDLRDGKCVQLQQGDFARETVYGVDPVAMAQHWHAQGAHRLHIVDLDAAREGRPVNDAIIRQIVTRLRGEVSVQVAGGVRDHTAIHRWIDAGVDRVVVGTLAVEHPELVERAMEKHQEKIAVAVDARGGKAAVKGWVETSEQPVDPLIRDLAVRGVRHFIYTDISRDGMLQHVDFDAVRRLLALLADTGAPASLIYSGGVTSIEDVVALNNYPLEGAIIGTALYDGRLDLAQARLALATGDGT